MLISEFDYHLPEELIAQQPLEDRAGARMLVVDRHAALAGPGVSGFSLPMQAPGIAWF